jgi:hypothetical protein
MEARRVSSDCRTSLFGEVDRDPTPISSRLLTSPIDCGLCKR